MSARREHRRRRTERAMKRYMREQELEWYKLDHKAWELAKPPWWRIISYIIWRLREPKSPYKEDWR